MDGALVADEDAVVAPNDGGGGGVEGHERGPGVARRRAPRRLPPRELLVVEDVPQYERLRNSVVSSPIRTLDSSTDSHGP